MADSRRRAWITGALAASFFALLTPWVLRPWFLSADDLPRDTSFFATVENSDLLLNTWILAWVARASVVDPSTLFDGNIFHPAANTIALSENMIAHVPVTGPVFAATGNALAVLKAMALESFVLAGLGMFALVFHQTRNAGAALAAGAVFTFAPWRVHGFPHPQYLATGMIPLSFLAIDLWVEHRRLRSLLGLAAAVALQILSCLYLGYFIAFGAGAYALVRTFGGRDRPASALAGVVAARAAGAILAAPIALPYLRARAEGVIPPFDPARFVGHAWAPWDYVSVAFVALAGVAVVALVLADVLERAIGRVRAKPIGFSSYQWSLWAVVGVAVLFSTGPYLRLGDVSVPTPYLVFYDYLPGFSSIRGPRRFFIVVLAGMSALGGHALARWTRRVSPWLRVAAGVAVALAGAAAAAPRPSAVLPARLGERAAPVYRWLADHADGGGVLEIPASAIEGDFVGAERNARYMLSSTMHWRPLINGYSGYEPATFSFLTTAIRQLPSTAALRFLVDAVDVRWIVVHRGQLIAHEKEQWARVPRRGLESVARFGDDEVYEVTLPPDRPQRDRLTAVSAAPTETWSGTPIAPLAPRCRQGRILGVEPPQVVGLTAFPIPIPVRFENQSSCPWPAVAVHSQDLVGLTYAWIDPEGNEQPRGPFSRLLGDVPPQSEHTEPVVVIPPFGAPGRWHLDVILEQRGVSPPIARARVPVNVKAMRP